MGQFDSYKRQVLDITLGLVQKGLLVGTGGNVSMLVEGEGLVAVTPSNRDYNDLGVDDICITNYDCELVEGQIPPSVETAMHIAVYKMRNDVSSVIHTHQVYASVYSLIGKPIPALFDEQVANLGNTVQVVPYALSGTVDLLNNIAQAVENQCNAFILQNHGCLILGTDIAQASRNVALLEKTAQVYYHALSTNMDIVPLPKDMEELIFTVMKSEQRKEIHKKKRLRKQKEKEQGHE